MVLEKPAHATIKLALKLISTAEEGANVGGNPCQSERLASKHPVFPTQSFQEKIAKRESRGSSVGVKLGSITHVPAHQLSLAEHGV